MDKKMYLMSIAFGIRGDTKHQCFDRDSWRANCWCLGCNKRGIRHGMSARNKRPQTRQLMKKLEDGILIPGPIPGISIANLNFKRQIRDIWKTIFWTAVTALNDICQGRFHAVKSENFDSLGNHLFCYFGVDDSDVLHG